MKGSEISGLFGWRDTFDARTSAVFEKGFEERSRMAWAIVGWNKPPYGEYADRWVGSTWPRVKNVDSALF